MIEDVKIEDVKSEDVEIITLVEGVQGKALLDYIEDTSFEDVTPIDLGKQSKAMGNVIRRGLIVIGGDAGAGKTSFSIDLSLEMVRTKKAKFIFYTLDDEMKMTAKRICTMLEGIHYLGFPKVKLEGRNLKATTRDILRDVYVKDTLKLNTIQSEIEAIKEEGKEIVVVIDYLHLIKEGRASSETEQIKQTIDTLKDIQKSTGSIMILLSQVTKEDSKKTQQDSNPFYGSNQVRVGADVCMVLSSAGNDKSLKIVKDKEGATGREFTVRISPFYTIFVEEKKSITEEIGA